MSIRGRLMAMLMIGLGAVLTSGGTAVYLVARAGLAKQFDARLESRVRTVASLVRLEPGRLVFASGDGPSETLGETFFELHTLEAGELLKRSGNLQGMALPMPAGLGEELRFANIDLPGDIDGRAVWLVFAPRIDYDDEDQEESEEEGDERIDTTPQVEAEMLVAVAALDRGPVDHALGAIMTSLAAVGCVLGLTIAVLITLGVRWGLVPLDKLRGQLGGVSARTISRRFDVSGAPRELEPVYRELNLMLDRVERTLERERSFADAAAHELRTPLAELRTTAEVAIRWPDPERAGAALEETLAIGCEMERIVESLLLISRGNAGAVDEQGEETAVAAIVQDCLRRSAEPIGEKSLRITVELEDGQTIRAPREALSIILRNLIANAVQYTPASGRIAIRGGGDINGSPRLVVENTPVDMGEDDLTHLFEPFWQSDEARSDREHVGLGLSVVDKIAHAIGLRVVADLEGERLQIRIFQ